MRKRSWNDQMFSGVMTIILILCAVIAVIPLLSVLALSFSSKIAVNTNAVTLFPVGFTLDSWKAIVTRPDMWRATAVTIGTTLVGTFLALIITSLLAYPLSKKEFGLQKGIMIMVVITMIFKAPTVPYFLTLRSIGLYNSVWAMILPHILTAYNMIVMRSFFYGIPESLREAAEIDGAGPIRTLVKVYLPLSLPVIATLALFYAVGRWNGFSDALLYVKKEELFPIQLYLYYVLQNSTQQEIATQEGFATPGVGETVKMATVMFATVPILLVYPWLQRYFIASMTIGAVKG